MINRFRPLAHAAAFALIAFAVHMSAAYLLKVENASLLPMLYGALFGMMLIILTILIMIKQKNIDSVGYAFMLLTCVKMVVIYLLFKTFAPEIGTDGLPKGHLIAGFFVMLGIETLCTIKMLNKN